MGVDARPLPAADRNRAVRRCRDPPRGRGRGGRRRAVPGRRCCARRRTAMLSSRMAGTGCWTPNCSASPTRKPSRRGLLRCRASWNMACSSALRGLLLSPVRTGCASSSGPDLEHEGSAPMTARLSVRNAIGCPGRACRAVGAVTAGRGRRTPSPARDFDRQADHRNQGRQAMFEPHRARRGREGQGHVHADEFHVGEGHQRSRGHRA